MEEQKRSTKEEVKELSIGNEGWTGWKVLVIVVADALANPGTMVIENQSAVVANVTMNRSWWSVQVA